MNFEYRFSLKILYKEGEDTPETALALKDECGDCYGAQTEERKCCNTCAEVQEAYRQKGWGISSFDQFEQCKKGSILI